MTNEQSSPALIPGTIPDGIFPALTCNGMPVQQAYEGILAITGVAIATGQRGPQGNPGPPGPAAEIDFTTAQYSLTSGSEQQTVTVANGRNPWEYIWTLVNPVDSNTPPANPTSIGYFSNVGNNIWRVTFTQAIPAASWTLYQVLITTN